MPNPLSKNEFLRIHEEVHSLQVQINTCHRKKAIRKREMLLFKSNHPVEYRSLLQSEKVLPIL